MKNYFEYGIKQEDLSHISSYKEAEYFGLCMKIKKRVDKLNEALQLTDLSGEMFSATIKPLFDNSFTVFEAMSAEKLAEFAMMCVDRSKTYPKRLEFPNADVVFDTDFVEESEWEAVRHIGIGGSDAAVVLGVSPYNTARNLYYSKTATPENMQEKDETREMIFARGHLLEGEVVKGFCRQSGAKVIPETRMFRSRKYPALTANIDAILELADGSLAVFEAKSTVAGNRPAWNNRVPVQYTPQPLQYLGVLDDPRFKNAYIGCIFADDIGISNVYCGSAYDSEKCIFHRIAYDKEVVDQQMAKEQSWWEDYVLCADVPERSGKPKLDLETIRTYEIGEPVPGKKIDIPESALEMIQNYLKTEKEKSDAAAVVEGLDTRLQNIKNELIVMLGEAQEGKIERDGFVYSVTSKLTKGRETVDSKKLKTAYPEVYQACAKTGAGSLRFGVKCTQMKEEKK